MQFRMSPGGRICSSSRRRPELPPSSDTVTIADNDSSHGTLSCRRETYCLRPDRRVDKPVPPPIATRRSPRSKFVLFDNEFTTSNTLPKRIYPKERGSGRDR